MQSVFEEQKKAYLETSKFGTGEVLGMLEKIMSEASKDNKSFGAAIQAASVWGDFLGAKAADGIREKLSDIKKSELTLKKKDIAVKEGLLKLERDKAREQIENYEKKVNRKVTIEVVKSANS